LIASAQRARREKRLAKEDNHACVGSSCPAAGAADRPATAQKVKIEGNYRLIPQQPVATADKVEVIDFFCTAARLQQGAGQARTMAAGPACRCRVSPRTGDLKDTGRRTREFSTRWRRWANSIACTCSLSQLPRR